MGDDEVTISLTLAFRLPPGAADDPAVAGLFRRLAAVRDALAAAAAAGPVAGDGCDLADAVDALERVAATARRMRASGHGRE